MTNRFKEAGIRARAEELMRKGRQQIMWWRIEVAEGTKEGDQWQWEIYKVTAEQDRGEDGKAACVFVLYPDNDAGADE